MSFYDEMRSVADELLSDFRQGVVELKRIASTSGSNSGIRPLRRRRPGQCQSRSSGSSALRERRPDRRDRRHRHVRRAGD